MEEFRISRKAAEDIAATLLEKVGVSERHAYLTAKHMVLADLRGVDTHGLVRLPFYVHRVRAGDLEANATPRIAEQGPATAVVDGEHGLGQVNSDFAMNWAVSKAKEFGIGAVAVRHSSHFGTAASYAAMATESDCIGISATNAPPLLAPIGGTERRIGNNPLSIAVPNKEGFPLILDIAMSAVAAWQIRMASERGEEIPPEWAFDRNGEPTTDAYAAFQGGGLLRPLGDHKGFGLALMVDVLAGVLSGGGFGAMVRRLDQQGYLNTSHFFIAIDITRFMAIKDFYDRISRMVANIHATPTRAGIDSVLVPGEKEARCQEDRTQNGIPYTLQVWNPILELAGELEVDLDQLLTRTSPGGAA
jgi:LDH2 family malate/lactate/ureidoglycolate dehydrogenase